MAIFMRFVNRQVELQELRKIFRSSKPSLVRVYGRRRLGKTELLRKLCREERGLYLLFDEADPPQQRESLSRQLATETGSLVIPYPSWDSFSIMSQKSIESSWSLTNFREFSRRIRKR